MTVRICPIEDAACEELPMFRRCEGCKKPQPTSRAMTQPTVTLPREVVRKALSRAYSLGQTYWQQADSESYSQNANADKTDATFKQLIIDTCAALDAPAPVDCRGCIHHYAVRVLQRFDLGADKVDTHYCDLRNCINYDKFQALPPISLTRVTK